MGFLAPAATAISKGSRLISRSVFSPMLDMTIHHEQGVLMTHFAQRNSGRREVAIVAYDIKYQQTAQIGR